MFLLAPNAYSFTFFNSRNSPTNSIPVTFIMLPIACFEGWSTVSSASIPSNTSYDFGEWKVTYFLSRSAAWAMWVADCDECVMVSSYMIS